jgi:hypothetical protein
VRLNTKNPPRRDVAVLQPKGYLVLAIPLDNPGAWLMHCHIGFHAAEGMNIQIAESMKEAVKQVKEADKMQKNCANWSQFQESKKLDQWASLHSGP